MQMGETFFTRKLENKLTNGIIQKEGGDTSVNFFTGKLENKVSNGIIHPQKEGGNTSMPEFRRSRSTPRGKFFILP